MTGLNLIAFGQTVTGAAQIENAFSYGPMRVVPFPPIDNLSVFRYCPKCLFNAFYLCNNIARGE